MAKERIAVVGVGAIGGSVAADLSDTGRFQMQLCLRTPIDSLEVMHPMGVSRVAAGLVTEVEAAQPVDWVLLATKAYQTEAAAPWLERLCTPTTVVAVLQNGINHRERVEPLLGDGVEILPVVIQLPAEKKAPDRVTQSHIGVLVVPESSAGHRFARLFEGGRTRVHVADDFVTQAWWKLLSNAALGGLSALALRELSFARDPDLQAIALRMMAEISEVARAEGANLPADAGERALELALKAAPDHWSSITVDRREGRRLEWQVRNAIVGERARRHGIGTPLNDLVTTLLRLSDEGRAER